MELEIVEESVSEVTRRLWERSLNYRVEIVPSIPDEIRSLPCRGAAVEIAGAWEGLALLQTTPQLAIDVACLMFDLPRLHSSSPERPASHQKLHLPTLEMVQDCLKELTNITAGNLKTALPEPCSLAIPKPLEFLHWDDFSFEGFILTQIAFLCEDFAPDATYFRISLIKRGSG